MPPKATELINNGDVFESRSHPLCFQELVSAAVSASFQLPFLKEQACRSKRSRGHLCCVMIGKGRADRWLKTEQLLGITM